MNTRPLRGLTIHADSIAVLALTLLAFGLRAWHLDGQSLWRDEVDVVRFAGWPLEQLLHGLTLAQHNGPVYYLVMRGWLAVAGESEFALRFLSLCGGVLCVPLTWRVARPLVGRRAALLAALLVTMSSYLVWYSQDGKMYAAIGALSLLAMWCWRQALDSGHVRWWSGFVLTASLGLYIHMLSALLIPVYIAALVVTWPRWRAHWRGWCLALGLLTVPYLPLAVWQLPLVWSTHDTGHAYVRLDEMVNVLLGLYARGVAMVGSWPAMVAFVFALLLGLFGPRVAGGSSERRSVLFLAVWSLLPVLLLYLISLRVPLFEPRYLVFILPPLFIVAARGIIALLQLSRPVGGALLAVVVAFNLLGVGVQAAQPLKSDFRAAAAFVATHYQSGEPIMFQVPYVRYVFDYYFQPEHPALDGPWTNDGKNEISAAQLMAATVSDSRSLWLVTSESWLWDERGLTRAWLDSHGEVLRSAAFNRVDIYHYRLSRAP